MESRPTAPTRWALYKAPLQQQNTNTTRTNINGIHFEKKTQKTRLAPSFATRKRAKKFNQINTITSTKNKYTYCKINAGGWGF